MRDEEEVEYQANFLTGNSYQTTKGSVNRAFACYIPRESMSTGTHNRKKCAEHRS
jgi:hypothetical protein